MLAERSIQVGPLKLNVMCGPAHGPPLVLLHGVIRCWQTFQPILPALAARWQVWGLDFPGHGKSQWSSGGYLVADYVQAASDWVRQQFQQPVAIYGHSLGAMAAAGVAAALGEQVSAAVLEDPPFDTMGSRIRHTPLLEYFRQLQPFAGDARSIAPIAKDLADLATIDPRSGEYDPGWAMCGMRQRCFMAHCLKQLDPGVLKPIVAERWLEGYDWRKTLAAVTCPVLLLQGDQAAGGMLTDADATAAVSLGHDVTCLKFAGAGHNLHVVRTQELLNVVTAFLEPLYSSLSS